MNKYHCDNCDKEVDDLGPYEMSNGDAYCQDCMEGNNMKLAEMMK